MRVMRVVVFGWVVLLASALSLPFTARAETDQERFEAARRRLDEKQRAIRQAASQPATRPAGAGTTQPASAAQPLEAVWAAVPKECWPDPGHPWDEFSIPKARKWARQNLVGKRVTCTLTYEGAEILRIPKDGDPDETVGWRINLAVSPIKKSVGRADAALWVCATLQPPGGGLGNRRGEIELVAPEAVAKQYRDMEPGRFIQLSGVIADTDVQAVGDADGPVFAVALKDFVVTPLPPTAKPVDAGKTGGTSRARPSHAAGAGR